MPRLKSKYCRPKLWSYYLSWLHYVWVYTGTTVLWRAIYNQKYGYYKYFAFRNYFYLFYRWMLVTWLCVLHRRCSTLPEIPARLRVRYVTERMLVYRTPGNWWNRRPPTSASPSWYKNANNSSQWVIIHFCHW